MRTWRREGAVFAVLMGLALPLALSSCDRGGSSAPARDHSAEDSGSRARDNGPGSDGPPSSGDRNGSRSASYNSRDERPRTPVPMVDGKPMWADNRQHTAQENVDYQYGKWGADLGAKDAKDYAARARRFIDHPPSDVQTLVRANGDKLMYDPDGNLFLVARKDGAPRTMFKPRDGAAYWKEQQAKAASGDTGYGGKSRRYHAPNPSEFGRSNAGDN